MIFYYFLAVDSTNYFMVSAPEPMSSLVSSKLVSKSNKSFFCFYSRLAIYSLSFSASVAFSLRRSSADSIRSPTRSILPSVSRLFSYAAAALVSNCLSTFYSNYLTAFPFISTSLFNARNSPGISVSTAFLTLA